MKRYVEEINTLDVTKDEKHLHISLWQSLQKSLYAVGLKM